MTIGQYTTLGSVISKLDQNELYLYYISKTFDEKIDTGTRGVAASDFPGGVPLDIFVWSEMSSVPCNSLTAWRWKISAGVGENRVEGIM